MMVNRDQKMAIAFRQDQILMNLMSNPSEVLESIVAKGASTVHRIQSHKGMISKQIRNVKLSVSSIF